MRRCVWVLDFSTNATSDNDGQFSIAHELAETSDQSISGAAVEIERISIKGNVADAGIERTPSHAPLYHDSCA